MNTFKLINPIKLKTGEVIPKGESVVIRFEKEDYLFKCFIFSHSLNREVRVRLGNLVRYIPHPSIETVARWDEDGICESVFGERVEPDGWDSDNAPSWAIVYGVI